MLLVLTVASLTGDFQLVVFLVLCDRAQTFNRQKILVGDAIDEHDSAHHLEVVALIADVPGSRISRVTRSQ